ncbi:hypothetical protein TrRE_jg424, partial [Triparma retinervis]
MGDELDERLDFVFKQITSTFKNVNPDKFQAFAEHEDTLNTIYEFLDGSLLTLFVSESRGNLSITSSPPSSLKSLHLFLTKPEPKPVSDEGYREEILQGDLTADAMEHMARVAIEVYLPLLTNEVNQDQWSE